MQEDTLTVPLCYHMHVKLIFIWQLVHPPANIYNSQHNISNHIKYKQPWFYSLYTEYICDMIKGNESDVGNNDFELQAERGDKFLFYIVFEF